MQQQTKVATPENGNNSRAIIPLAVPVPSDQPQIQVGPIISGLSEEIIKEHLMQLNEMLGEFVKLESAIRLKMREMLDQGVPEHMNVNPTKMLDGITTDAVTNRHVRRYLQATITEREIGLPPNSLIESHSRELDKLQSPEEKRLAYDMCLASAESEKLTAKHFNQAVKRVIETRLTGTNAANEDAIGDSIEGGLRIKGDTPTRIYKKIAKNGRLSKASFYKTILECDKADLEIIHSISSAKLLDADKTTLALLLMKSA